MVSFAPLRGRVGDGGIVSGFGRLSALVDKLRVAQDHVARNGWLGCTVPGAAEPLRIVRVQAVPMEQSTALGRVITPPLGSC